MLQDILAVIGAVGLLASSIAGPVAAFRSLKRGPKEDKALEVELQARIVTMAREWLEDAQERLDEAVSEAREARKEAEEANARATVAEKRTASLERNLTDALGAIDVLWPWGLNGGGEPTPKLPGWIVERLHNQSKGT